MALAGIPPGIHLYLTQEYTGTKREDLLAACLRQEAAWRGLDIQKLTLVQGAFGKPYVPEQANLHFSISHSGLFWLAAFATQPLGVDLQLHDTRDYLRIARRWFHPEELAYVEAYGRSAFYDVWSSKESYLKYTGRGLSNDLPGFSVVKSNKLRGQLAGAAFLRPDFQEGYSLALCTAHPKPLQFLALPEQ